MNESLTIYFDTSFFVNLARADDIVARESISELNKLGVRHVISAVLVRELLSNANARGQDTQLFERIQMFEIAPYSSEEGLNWDFLLEGVQIRNPIAQIVTELDEISVLAHSYAALSRRSNTEEEQKRLLAVTEPLLNDLGFPTDLSDLDQTIEAALRPLRELGIELPKGLRLDDPTILSHQILGMLSDDEIQHIENDNKLKSSSTTSDDRAFKVALGEASDKAKRKLANHLRDTDHMLVFLNHRNSIDFLHIDSNHEKLLKTVKPQHFLIETGLANRCFSADTLSETVEKIGTFRK